MEGNNDSGIQRAPMPSIYGRLLAQRAVGWQGSALAVYESELASVPGWCSESRAKLVMTLPVKKQASPKKVPERPGALRSSFDSSRRDVFG
ncbi:uncharacterized protein LMH87_008058 [Akanthomyces muscarius]|uniref:Uncharacterized protein n=1 Tax=Akanthomyces muscarius TaxID=2231603 RepID=A0A9W8QJP9_AKAMU|nr:uncharacterized protein LMH87_008058 [Akanthomyces muscarius]KAJ4159146.1 hypothetical protein LMH87_008058 [Akanthomyces muscarius]